MNKQKIKIIAISVVLYLLSSGLSFVLFAQTLSGSLSSPISPTKTEDGRVVFDDSLPKTEACPLNGAKYSKQQKSWWEEHRPLGVMIENHENSRPQSGLSSADVVYEVVAEGGITRFLALFYCQDAGFVGPVRSARTYFLDFVSEYGDSPLYAHVGGANQPGPADAISQINQYGWGGHNDINQFSVGFPTFWRDYDRLGHTTSTEHTMYSTTTKLWEYAEKTRDLKDEGKDGTAWTEGFVEYSFKDGKATGSNQTVHLEFWDGDQDYFVDWKYDPKTNNYLRNHNASSAHIDNNNKKQVGAKNVVVLYMRESSANDGYENNAHLLYTTKGTGKAIVFQNGERINATWKKDKRTSRTILTDSKGDEIEFVRGPIWFSVLPTDGVVSVK